MIDFDFAAHGGMPSFAKGAAGPSWNFGLVRDLAEIDRVNAEIEAEQGAIYLHDLAPHLKGAGAEQDVFFWELEAAILGRVLPSWNQGRIGTCFPAGTRIRMEDGTNKPIEQVRLLDKVLTAEGNIGVVTHLFVKPEERGLTSVKLWGHNALRMTVEHPVLTKRGYVRAGELRQDDYVALPRYLPCSNKFIVPADHVVLRRTAKSDGYRRYAGVAERGGLTVCVKAMPEVIEMTAAAGRIIGLFLAEGSTDSGKVIWTFGAHEEETLVAELVSLLKSEWGVEAHAKKLAAHNTVKVAVYGTAWAKLFEGLCSSGSGRKRLHPDVASGPRDFMEAVLKGWMSGDGYASRRSEPDLGVTVSHDLALSMYDIAQALGLRPVLRQSEPSMNRHAKTRQTRWEMKYGSQADNWRVEQDDTHVWRKVRSLEQEDFSGWVFNFEVEGDNSYVAEGVGVHNCVSFGWGRGVQDLLLAQIARKRQTGQDEQWPGAEVATEPIYGGSRIEVGRSPGGEGSIGSWAAKWVKDWGILLRQKYGAHDLSVYSEARSRDWGDRGVPDVLEPEAKLRPVRSVALVRTPEELRDGLAAWKPGPICGSTSRTTQRRPGGWCPKTGNEWSHCEEVCGVCIVRGGSQSSFGGDGAAPWAGDVPAFVERNSWGDYLGSGNATVALASGRTVTLPMGCYLSLFEERAQDLRGNDTFVISDSVGWPAESLSWYI